MTDYIPNHVELSVEDLVTMLRQPRVEGMVRIVAEEAQELEDALFALLTERGLTTAIGAQLDQLGAVVGEPRAGLNDADYRGFIGARLLANLSNGEPARLVEVLSIVASSEDVHYVPLYPAALFLEYVTEEVLSDERRTRIRTLLEAIVPAGVKIEYIVEAPVGYFGFDDDPDALGFDEGGWAEDI